MPALPQGVNAFAGRANNARLLLKDRVWVSYPHHRSRDNAEMEPCNSRLTPALAGGARESENRSLFLHASALSPYGAVVVRRMDHYNHERRHSTIGYGAPSAFIATLQPVSCQQEWDKSGPELGHTSSASTLRRPPEPSERAVDAVPPAFYA